MVLHTLGGTEASLRERLLASMIPSFLSPCDEAVRGTGSLAPRLAHDISDLHEQLSCVPDDSPGRERGSIGATIDSLDDFELSKMADRMSSLCIEVMQTFGVDAFDLPSLNE